MHVCLGEGGSCWMLFSVNKDVFFLLGLAHLVVGLNILANAVNSFG